MSKAVDAAFVKDVEDQEYAGWTTSLRGYGSDGTSRTSVLYDIRDRRHWARATDTCNQPLHMQRR